jgi:chromate transporter
MTKETGVRTLSYTNLFWIFFKAGMAFGGGLGILAVLEDQLVDKLKVVSREDFLTNYGIGRIVPSGTMTALAVAYGYRFGGVWGTIVTLSALVLPAFLITLVLTAAYRYMSRGPLLEFLPVSILPAALALIIAAALKLGKDMFRPSIELAIAIAAFGGVLLLHVNPSILLLLGGVAGMFVWRKEKKEEQ